MGCLYIQSSFVYAIAVLFRFLGLIKIGYLDQISVAVIGFAFFCLIAFDCIHRLEWLVLGLLGSNWVVH